MKKILSLLIAAALCLALVSLSACSGKVEPAAVSEPAAPAEAPAEEPAEAPAAEAPAEKPEAKAEAKPAEEAVEEPAEEAVEEPEEAPAEEPAEELPAEGEYTLFAMESEGYLVNSDEMEMYSVLTLDEDGSGYMTMDDDGIDVTGWSAEDGKITVETSDGGVAEGEIANGVIVLDILGTGDYLLYFAREGADTSGYEAMGVDELLEQYAAGAAGGQAADSLLGAVLDSIDLAGGVHMSYEVKSDYLDSEQAVEVNAAEGVYYASRTVLVAGYEETAATFYRDGKAFTLWPDDMTGVLATETSSGIIENNVLMLDSLYSAIWTYGQQTDYTVEEREMDGAVYTAEVYPAGDYQPGAVFFFNDAGRLCYYLEGAPVTDVAVDIGETLYTVLEIGSGADEALFDISGYEITE